MAKGPSRGQRVRIAKGIHIYTRLDSPHWQADIVYRGRRARIGLGTADPAEARTLAIQKAAAFHTEAGEVGDYSFVRALIDWTKHAPRSARETSMVARLRQLYGNRPAAEVDEGSLMEALADLTPSYANRILNIARAALRLAARHKRIPAAPMIGRRKEPPGRARFLSPEEWAALRAELPDYLLVAVTFSLETGLRKENALRLQWRNVDLRRSTAWVDAVRAKAKVAIPVPLSPLAVQLLRAEQGKHPEYVFTRPKNPRAVKNRDQQPLVPIGNPKKAWYAALERAGVHDFRWHDQRHTWASWHTMSGTGPQVLKELGGWASMDMVQRYAHLEPGHLRTFAGAAGKALAAATKRVKKPCAAA